MMEFLVKPFAIRFEFGLIVIFLNMPQSLSTLNISTMAGAKVPAVCNQLHFGPLDLDGWRATVRKRLHVKDWTCRTLDVENVFFRTHETSYYRGMKVIVTTKSGDQDFFDLGDVSITFAVEALPDPDCGEPHECKL
jgi:hypothetical protein